MQLFTALWILIVAAYLLGSVNSAIIVCKLMGLPSPRTVGSGNPGATNVLRLGNRKAAALTFVGDFFEGRYSRRNWALFEYAPDSVNLGSIGNSFRTYMARLFRISRGEGRGHFIRGTCCPPSYGGCP